MSWKCKILGHRVNKSILIYNQIKPPNLPKKDIICERCKKAFEILNKQK